MKNKYILVSSLLLSNYFSRSQNSEAQNETPKVNTTEIEVLYNHYLQDGNNSAVTGGIGTERLTVYGPSVNVKKGFGNNTISIQLGADIISSASTDRIDFVNSSASRLDARTYTNLNYSRLLEKNKLSINAGVGFSIESDYFSFAKYLGATKTSKDKMQTYSLDIQIFNDDLRWGRLNSTTNYGPSNLVYPVELRDREWYDVEKRNTYNTKLGFTQVINKRNVFGAIGAFSYQEGLLATPFHRIYFNDGTLGVEQLPKERYKTSLGLKLNSFVSGNLILKNTVTGYTDNFGINAFSLENETALKINPKVTFYGNLRFYTQTESKYFAPYMTHDINERFYTSDYDLSKFNTVKLGLGVKFSPYKFKTKRKRFDSVTLRYNYLTRSNNLSGHMLSMSIQSTRFKPRKQKN